MQTQTIIPPVVRKPFVTYVKLSEGDYVNLVQNLISETKIFIHLLLAKKPMDIAGVTLNDVEQYLRTYPAHLVRKYFESIDDAAMHIRVLQTTVMNALFDESKKQLEDEERTMKISREMPRGKTIMLIPPEGRPWVARKPNVPDSTSLEYQKNFIKDRFKDVIGNISDDNQVDIADITYADFLEFNRNFPSPQHEALFASVAKAEGVDVNEFKEYTFEQAKKEFYQ